MAFSLDPADWWSLDPVDREIEEARNQDAQMWEFYGPEDVWMSQEERDEQRMHEEQDERAERGAYDE